MPGGLFHVIGNPLSDDTWTYTWEKGRQLKKMQSVDTDASFVYNENGLRVQKTVNGVVTDYTLHGKNIVHMTQGSDNLHFFYDTQGKPSIVEYNDKKYAYVYNLQGDIVAILDSTGAVVVSYVYDAWGWPIKKEGSLAETLGTVQPFRYRGYVFDEETGLYYLRSRYYMPLRCRFITADDTAYLGVDAIMLSNDIYVYCNNCPVHGYDPNGAFNLGGFLLGAALVVSGVALAVVTAGASVPATVAVASAAVTTMAVSSGVAISTAAATDSAAVVDFSVTVRVKEANLRYGKTWLFDYTDKDAAVYSYRHIGGTTGDTTVSFATGLVFNYDEPNDYKGPFVDAGVGGKYGIDVCWDPSKPISESTGAVCCTMDFKNVFLNQSELSMSAGYDFYFPPEREW